MRKLFIALTFLLVPACLSAQLGGKIYLQRADSLLQRVLSLYEVKKYGLLMETYPRNPKQQITYTANTGSEVTQQEVSFLYFIRQWYQVAYRFIKHPATRSTKN